MNKESTISRLIRENHLGNISSALEYVNDAIALFENILASASEYFEELDRFYDEITELKYIGKAPEAFSKVSDKELKIMILSKKRDALRRRLINDKELRDATVRINQFLKTNRIFENLGLKVFYGEMSAKDVLFNYYKLIEAKRDLELRSNLYKN